MEDWEMEPDAVELARREHVRVQEEFEEQACEATLVTLFDNPAKPVSAIESKKRVRDPAYRSLAQEVRALPHRQRLFLRFMVTNQMHAKRAIAAMNKAMGTDFSIRVANDWMTQPGYRTLLEKYAELACAASGVQSVQSTLLRIDEIVEDALKPVPMVFKGEVVKFTDDAGERRTLMEVDRGSALKGLEMIGKANGAFKSDEQDQRRVTVVLDFSGETPAGEAESEVIDGEFEERP
jgi:hypothetical protein